MLSVGWGQWNRCLGQRSGCFSVWLGQWSGCLSVWLGQRSGCHPPRLWLPVGAVRLCPGMRGCRHPLCGTLTRGGVQDGRQGWGEAVCHQRWLVIWITMGVTWQEYWSSLLSDIYIYINHHSHHHPTKWQHRHHYHLHLCWSLVISESGNCIIIVIIIIIIIFFRLISETI